MRERILIIHQGALGDLVLSFPALLSLKDRRKASLSLLSQRELGLIAHRFNVVDAFFSLESAMFCTLFSGEMTPLVKTFLRKYEIIVLISFSETVEEHIRRNCDKTVYRISPRPSVDEETHVTCHLLKELQKEGLMGDSSSFLAGTYRREQQREMGGVADQGPEVETAGLGSCLMHPGAGSPRKRWPAENFIRLAAMIRGDYFREVAFVVGPAEKDLTGVIKKRDFQVYEDCSLLQLIPLLNEATCYIGLDSGVTHLASFLGTPTIAIFGPSNPKRWAPKGPVVRVLRAEQNCAPCFELERANCSDPQCLKGLSVDRVLGVVKDLTAPACRRYFLRGKHRCALKASQA